MHLRCRVEGAPWPTIKWYKDGVDVETWVLNKDVIVKQDDDGWCELHNPEAYPEDSGEYRCIASNGIVLFFHVVKFWVDNQPSYD